MVETIALSPDFANDRTIFAHITLSYLPLFSRSTDGGKTWQTYGSPAALAGINEFAFSPNFAADGTCFATSEGFGVWRTVDRGSTWQQVNTGITDMNARFVAVSPSFATDQTVLVATMGGVFRSTDGGTSWVASSTGLVETKPEVIAFAPDDPSVAFTGRNDLHRSNDGGQTWVPVHTFGTGLESITLSSNFSVDGGLAVSFGFNNGGVEASVDGGLTWALMLNGLTELAINQVALADDGTIFAASRDGGGVFKAPTLLAPWTLFSNGLEYPSPLTQNHYRDVCPSPDYSSDSIVFASGYEGMFISTDSGANYSRCDIYPPRVLRQIQLSPDFATDRTMWVGSYGGGVQSYRARSVGFGNGQFSGCAPSPMQTGTWEMSSNGLLSLWSMGLLLSPDFRNDNTIFYGYFGLWKSTNGGASWNIMNYPPSITVTRGLDISSNWPTDQTIFVGSDNGQGTYRSSDGGASWTPLTSGLPAQHSARRIAMSPDFTTDQTVFLGMRNNGVFRSSDGGNNWTPLTSGIPSPVTTRTVRLSPTFAFDQHLWVGTLGNGIFRSTDGGNQFQQVNTGLPSGVPLGVVEIAVSPNFDNDRTVYIATISNGVYRSTDAGSTWSLMNNGMPKAAIWNLVISPSFPADPVLVATTMDGVWYTLDGGANWRPLPGFVRVDDKHPSTEYFGTWAKAPIGLNTGGTVHASNTPDDTIKLGFYGNSISWLALKDSTAGIAEVSLDGQVAALVDLYDPGVLMESEVFTRYFQTDGWHTIEVRVTGSKNAFSGSTTVGSDGFSYTASIGLPYSLYGAGHFGIGGVETRIGASGCPRVGESFSIDVTEGPGAAAGMLIVGTSPTRLPMLDGYLLVSLPVSGFSSVLGGVPGVAGTGSDFLPVSLPRDPTLTGVSVFVQAGYLDSTAPGGATLTQGLQVTIQ